MGSILVLFAVVAATRFEGLILDEMITIAEWHCSGQDVDGAFSD
jgi:hypothetical protein